MELELVGEEGGVWSGVRIQRAPHFQSTRRLLTPAPLAPLAGLAAAPGREPALALSLEKVIVCSSRMEDDVLARMPCGT